MILILSFFLILSLEIYPQHVTANDLIGVRGIKDSLKSARFRFISNKKLIITTSDPGTKKISQMIIHIKLNI
jgi:hypothetical protein